jgi:hypothetical protein
LQHYQHLREKRQHLKQAAIQANRQNGQQAGNTIAIHLCHVGHAAK